MDGVTTEYYYVDGVLYAQVCGDDTLVFWYDDTGRPYAIVYNGTPYYYEYNLQGDVVGLIDTDYTKLVTYIYGPYGDLLALTDTSTTGIGTLNPFRYRGYYYDAETGLYYCNSRYYDPQTGRWVNADGYVSTGQGISGHNMFTYCGNNPVNFADYSGQRYSAATTVKDESADERKASCAYQNSVSQEKAKKANASTIEKIGKSLVTVAQGVEGSIGFGLGFGASTEVAPIGELAVVKKLDVQQIHVNGFDGFDFRKEDVGRLSFSVGPFSKGLASGKSHSDLCWLYQYGDHDMWNCAHTDIL